MMENGNLSGYCFKNNGDITFVNLNAGMGATPEEIINNMDTNLDQFQCDLAAIDTGGHDQWLTNN